MTDIGEEECEPNRFASFDDAFRGGLKTMKILLIQPAKEPVTLGGEDVFLFEPLALEYVAAGVSNRHDVRILDQRLDMDVDRALEDFSPDVVGISAYTVHLNVVRSLFEQVKAWRASTLTVVGGHHATVAPQDFLSPFIDLIVVGEGVFAFREIIERFERGADFRGIPGVALAGGKGLVMDTSPKLVDLDALPFPDRTLTARYRREYYSEYMKPLASMRTSKGCPFRCNFCALWKLTGGRYLRRAPEKVVEELAGIEEEYVFFADDESLVDASRMRTLAQMIAAAGIRKRYYLYGRTDTIARNRDLLSLWKSGVLERVFVGFEFFRDEDLALVGKGSTTNDNLAAARILNDLGIDMHASFIVRPEFDRNDFEAMRRYCRSLGVTYVGFAVLTPLPGTDYYEEVKDALVTNDPAYFDFIHTVLPTELPIREFYEEYMRLATGAVSPINVMSFLRKFAWRDLPGALLKFHRFADRMKTVHRDYDIAAQDIGSGESSRLSTH